MTGRTTLVQLNSLLSSPAFPGLFAVSLLILTFGTAELLLPAESALMARMVATVSALLLLMPVLALTELIVSRFAEQGVRASKR